ncbi:MAG: hypothetical protein M3069_32115 [Chloroflexota bacterium]|nr:hypothetical protein [Chloroflexota bacterium]
MATHVARAILGSLAGRPGAAQLGAGHDDNVLIGRLDGLQELLTMSPACTLGRDGQTVVAELGRSLIE